MSDVERIEDLLAELEEQRLMVLEDKPTAQAWLVGYFESKDDADDAWKRLAEMADAIEPGETRQQARMQIDDLSRERLKKPGL